MDTLAMHQRRHDEKKQHVGRGITRGQAMLILLMTCLTIYLLGGLVFASESVMNDVEYKVISVREGDSLWKIAIRYHEQAGMELTECVDEMIVMNELDGAIIYPGQNLKVPIPVE